MQLVSSSRTDASTVLKLWQFWIFGSFAAFDDFVRFVWFVYFVYFVHFVQIQYFLCQNILIFMDLRKNGRAI